MLGILRFILLGILFYAALRAVQYIFRLTGPNAHRRPGGFQSQPHDRSNEVKNASFNAEDVEDAKFKDIK